MSCLEQITNSINNVSGIVTKAVASPEFVSSQYFPILLFLGVAIGLSCVVMVIPFLLRKMRPDAEKNSPYECGFEGEGRVRNEFDVQFYLVAILFIIFDLEVAFLFPWAVSLGTIGVFGFWSMMVFLILLTVGFIYEWKRGALEWK
jgi:NADH-quinone oxidoreductase subunit A